ncbi:MAG: D-alanine--D-alanine ligase [Chloroflexi bacterium]|nr:D-alanine--D-alanine ligase [Chloroflexota bacterium]
MRSRLRVAVVFGGQSGEHEVSLLSARSVMQALDKTKYSVLPVGISTCGRWLTAGDPWQRLSDGEDSDCDTAVNTGSGALVPGWEAEHFPAVDLVFPVLHGPMGEDGTVQGLFELAGLPYVGSGVLGSAAGMDKLVMKDIFAAHGLPVVPHVGLLRSRWQAEPEACLDEIEARLTYPIFVKPANLGSSVGITKAYDRTDLASGLNLAASYDRRLLAEQGVDAREIECAVLGNDTPRASVCGEVVSNREFYDYRAKYIDNQSRLFIPAEIPTATSERIRSLAVQAFMALDCAGLARVDFLLDRASGEVYLLEVNTMPGFTSISMYPKLWEASGLPYSKLLDQLIELALERAEERHQARQHPVLQ